MFVVHGVANEIADNHEEAWVSVSEDATGFTSRAMAGLCTGELAARVFQSHVTWLSPHNPYMFRIAREHTTLGNFDYIITSLGRHEILKGYCRSPWTGFNLNLL